MRSITDIHLIISALCSFTEVAIKEALRNVEFPSHPSVDNGAFGITLAYIIFPIDDDRTIAIPHTMPRMAG